MPIFPGYLEIKLDFDENNLNSTSLINLSGKIKSKIMPGDFCCYNGSLTPVSNELNTSSNDYLEVNSKDFLSTLQRFLNMKLDHSNMEIINPKNEYENISNFYKSFLKHDINTKYSNFFKLDLPDYSNTDLYHPNQVT